MSSGKETIPLTQEDIQAGTRQYLFPAGEDMNTFAVLDGAAIPDLLDHLYADPRPDFLCLYRGELEPDIAEIAPYLVHLKPDEPFTDWILSEGWGKSRGIFALAQVDLSRMRRHFRTLLMVKEPDGSQVYFRFYDPRVLPVFLPTCNARELPVLFGPVLMFLCEGESPRNALVFRVESDRLKTKAISLGPT